MNRKLGGGVLAALLMAGCWDGGRSTAERAMAAVQSSYDAVKADAARYLPEQAARVEEAVSAARQTFAEGEYMRALSDVQRIGRMVTQLGVVIEAKREAFTRSWHEMMARIPQLLEKLQKDVETLTQSTSLPPGVTREAVEAARRALPVLRERWEGAIVAFRETDPSAALQRATAVQTKLVEVMRSLRMPIPGALSEQSPPAAEATHQ